MSQSHSADTTTPLPKMIPIPSASGARPDTTRFIGDSEPAMRISCKKRRQSCSFTSCSENGCGIVAPPGLSGAAYGKPRSNVLPLLTSTSSGNMPYLGPSGVGG